VTPEEMARIVADPHVTNEAFRLIMFVASHGPGEHDIEADELRMVLGCKDDRVVRAARERAARLGFIEWRRTGRGNTYRYADHAQNAQSDHAKSAQSAPPVVVDDGDITPLVPLEHPVAVKAMQAIGAAEEKLVGCRGARVDYLQARVPEHRQYAYVQSVVAWIDNPLTAFRGPNGMPVPQEERTKLLAVALNEMNATNEGKRKHDEGDPANLKNKLGFVIRDRYAEHQKATGTDGHRTRAGPRGKAPADQNDYGEGTQHWPGKEGFNG
jgi:hypothetical protein